MKMPVPLGGIGVHNNINYETAKKIESCIRTSLEFANTNLPVLSEYVKQHAQTMNEDVMKMHIDLYVNDFTLSLGEKGKHAIEKLYELYLRAVSKDTEKSLFL